MGYKRLTRRNADGTTWVKCAVCDIQDKCDFTKESCCQELEDCLAELEDKIEQGTLIELKKGKWLNSEKAFTSYVCSECGGEPMYSPDMKGKAYITITKFCPSCGAKMDFTEEDE